MKLTLVLLFACLALQDLVCGAPQDEGPDDDLPYPEDEAVMEEALLILFNNLKVLSEEGATILETRPSNFDTAFKHTMKNLRNNAKELFRLLDHQWGLQWGRKW